MTDRPNTAHCRLCFLAGASVVLALWAAALRGCDRAGVVPERIVRDTVVIRDTVRPPVPAPRIDTVVRYDTIRVSPVAIPPMPDSLKLPPWVDAPVPITRRTYCTEDYTAVVEGFRPRLASIEIYRTREIVTETRYRSPRWAVTIGPGVGVGPEGIRPYVGVSAGFVVWSK